MTDHDAALDQLITDLKARAADPQRRADVIVDAFSASVRTMDFGGLLGAGRSMAGSLDHLLGEIRSTGMPSAQSRSTADAVGMAMGTPAPSTLPVPAAPATVEAADLVLGGRLPDALRRAYLEVADGASDRAPACSRCRLPRQSIATTAPNRQGRADPPGRVAWGGLGLDEDEPAGERARHAGMAARRSPSGSRVDPRPTTVHGELDDGRTVGHECLPDGRLDAGVGIHPDAAGAEGTGGGGEVDRAQVRRRR